MKKIVNLLLALPLLMLAACAEDQALAPAEEHTYTLNAQVATIDSRLSYEEEGGRMKCHWELGDKVTVKSNDAIATYDFTVTKVHSDGTAVLSYTGEIPNANNFTGTATYAPRDVTKVNLQKADNNTDHLKYGETMVATITNQKLEDSNLTFSHPSTAIYKVKFKTPLAMTAGSVLTLKGAWTEDAKVTLDFSAAQGEIVTAYLMHTGGTITSGGELKILIMLDSKLYGYTHYSSKALTYETGKYWVADITNKKMVKEAELPVPEPVDLALPSGIKWGSFDLGAAAEVEMGGLYGWGCIEPYDASATAVTWTDYFHTLGLTGSSYSDATCGTSDDPLASYVNNQTSIVGTEWDAARQKLGGAWRMPTKADFDELRSTSNCSWKWYNNYNNTGKKGWLVTSVRNSSTIFLPAYGYLDSDQFWPDQCDLWCGTPTGNISTITFLYADASDYKYQYYQGDRFKGMTIRPIYDPSSVPAPDPEAVDLGLSVNWANMNLGARNPEESGDYYGWGCTDPYALTDNVRWNSYFTKLGVSGTSAIEDAGTDKDPLKGFVYPNFKSIGGTEYDIAHTKLGGNWRMPTKAEQEELNDNTKCTWQPATVNGVDGYTITSKVPGYEGNSIFLPKAGYREGTSILSNTYYWSSTPFQAEALVSRAEAVFLGTSERYWYNTVYRHYGCPIRAVCTKSVTQ